MDWFQKGEYPVRQVVFCSFDSVTGGLFTGLLKAKYGRVDIVHQLRESGEEADEKVLLRTTRPVVTTCWDGPRTLLGVSKYVEARGWKASDVRVYALSERLL